MKNKYFKFIAAFILVNAALFSQSVVKQKKHVSFFTGMGIQYGITPEFRDFLVASIPYSTSDSIKSFNAGVEFFGGAEFDLSKSVSAGIDYSYYIRGLSYIYSPAVFDYTITSHQPYVFVNYNLRKPKFNFKFGGSVGYHFQQLDNKINNSTTLKYTSSGASARLNITFLPKFSENFYVYLSGFAFANLYGKLKDENGEVLKAPNSNTEADLKGYGVGARLGILFHIN